LAVGAFLYPQPVAGLLPAAVAAAGATSQPAAVCLQLKPPKQLQGGTESKATKQFKVGPKAKTLSVS
jgi:hypothetical protein